MPIFILVIVFLSAIPCTSIRAETNIDVLSYYDAPPFYYKDGTGLVQDIVEALSRNSEDLNLKQKIISRPALNRIITNISKPIIIPLTNPLWFDDANKQKYQWSKALYKDMDALISHKNDPVEFEGERTFQDQSVGVPAGFSIYLLDELVVGKRATRRDISDMSVLVNAVANRNIRMAVVPYALGYYQVQQNGLAKTVHFSKRPQQSYDRFFLLKNFTDDQLDAFNLSIVKIKQNGVLKNILKKYGY